MDSRCVRSQLGVHEVFPAKQPADTYRAEPNSSCCLLLTMGMGNHNPVGGRRLDLSGLVRHQKRDPGAKLRVPAKCSGVLTLLTAELTAR